MTINDHLQTEIKAAMRAREKQRLATLRMAHAAIRQVEIDQRIELDDAGTLAVFERMVKQRRESVEQFRAAGREELVEIELAEIEILQEFLPEPLSEADLNIAIDQAIANAEASSMQDMGKVMAELKSTIQGRADMGAVSATVRQRLLS